MLKENVDLLRLRRHRIDAIRPSLQLRSIIFLIAQPQIHKWRGALDRTHDSLALRDA